MDTGLIPCENKENDNIEYINIKLNFFIFNLVF